MGSFTDAHGRDALFDTLARGQYPHQDGLMYGGKDREWSNRTLETIVQQTLRTPRRSPSSTGTPASATTASRSSSASTKPAASCSPGACDWWGKENVDGVRPHGMERPNYTGLVFHGVQRFLGNREMCGAVIEFGTRGVNMRRVLRLDQWLRRQDGLDSDIRAALEADMMDAFCPFDGQWRRDTLTSGLKLTDQAFDRTDRMVSIKYDNQGDAISREVPRDGAGADRCRRQRQRAFLQLRRYRPAERAVARGLLKRGLKRGDRVAILSANRAEFLLTFLGTMQAGMVSVPVNYKLPRDTVAYILEDSDAKLVIGDDARLALAPDACRKISFDWISPSLLDQGPFTPPRCSPRNRRCSSTPRARPAGPRAWRCRTRAALGGQPARAPAGAARPALRWWRRRSIT